MSIRSSTRLIVWFHRTYFRIHELVIWYKCKRKGVKVSVSHHPDLFLRYRQTPISGVGVGHTGHLRTTPILRPTGTTRKKEH